MAEISIIMPVYNVKRYLRKCLDSVLDQTFTDYELIIVDDGSTDGSGEICDEYKEKDKRIIVIHQNNSGQGIARNAGLDIAKGEYIGFIDSDDWIHKDMYNILYNQIVKRDSDVVACYRHRTVNERLKEKQIKKFQVTDFTNKEALFNLYELKLEKNKPLLFSAVWDKLYKKELWSNLRFPPVRYNEDVCIMYKLLDDASKISLIDAQLCYYRERPNSTSRSNIPRYQLIYLDCLEERTEYFKGRDKDLYVLSFFDYIRRLIICCCLLKNSADKNVMTGLYKRSCKEIIAFMTIRNIPLKLKRIFIAFMLREVLDQR